jgi:cation:H+ antiporter
MFRSRDERRLAVYGPGCAFWLFAALEIQQVPPETALWATPAILIAAMMIAWAAESAQFFVAQGFALAILAWLQTLPEFAVEAVLAWKQQVPLLLANLTGALRLLTGLGWPMIYFTAALFHRLKWKRPLNQIDLEEEHCVEVVGLFAPLIYASYIWYKASLDLNDAAILILIYVAYLWILSKMPAHDPENIEELDRIPRAVVQARPLMRNIAIGGLFAAGGAVIYFSAEPFLASLLAVSAMIGVPSFVFVQWVAPFVSEFPEKVSAFYWAKTIQKAPMALMNMVSSNINQWTLLAAMLPIVFSWSRGAPAAIPFDETQELEILMTIGQSLVGMIFLVNMKLVWWEAAALFGLWFIQFAFSPVHNAEGVLGFLANNIHWYVTVVYLVWSGVGLLGFLIRPRTAIAFRLFGKMWRTYVRLRPA